MITSVLIIFGLSTAYLAGYVLIARRLYAGWRPSRVPLCGLSDDHLTHRHHRYRRPGDQGCYGYFTDNGAVALALAAAILWPAILPGAGLVKLTRMRQPSTPAERKSELKVAVRDLESATRQLHELNEASRQHGTFETK